MSQSKRRTIKRDSIIPREETSSDEPVKQGLPEEEEEVIRQTAVWLSDGQVDWLDQKLQEIKRGGWRGATRSGLIRAIIEAGIGLSPNLSGVATEPEITRRFLAAYTKNSSSDL